MNSHDKNWVGKRGEDIASEYLKNKGYRVRERNFRAKQYGEVDIVADSPSGKELVFIEVKTRTDDEFGSPEEAVNNGKMREIMKMVKYYYALNPSLELSPRIDVVAITLSEGESVKSLEHFENVTL